LNIKETQKGKNKKVLIFFENTQKEEKNEIWGWDKKLFKSKQRLQFWYLYVDF